MRAGQEPEVVFKLCTAEAGGVPWTPPLRLEIRGGGAWDHTVSPYPIFFFHLCFHVL